MIYTYLAICASSCALVPNILIPWMLNLCRQIKIAECTFQHMESASVWPMRCLMNCKSPLVIVADPEIVERG